MNAVKDFSVITNLDEGVSHKVNCPNPENLFISQGNLHTLKTVKDGISGNPTNTHIMTVTNLSDKTEKQFWFQTLTECEPYMMISMNRNRHCGDEEGILPSNLVAVFVTPTMIEVFKINLKEFAPNTKDTAI